VAVMTQTPFDMLRAELDLLKNLRVRLETNQRAIGLAIRFPFVFLLELALFECSFDEFAFAKTADQKFLRERIDSFSADAVQPDAELEDLIIVFCARVDFGN